MGSIFVAPGTNDAMDQNQQAISLGRNADQLIQLLLPNIMEQIKFGNMLEPQRQQLISQALALMKPENYVGMANQAGNSMMSAAGDRAKYAEGLFGANSGAAKGAWRSGLNAATGGQNDFLANLWNPQNRLATAGQGLQLIGGQSSPSLNNFAQLAGIISGAPRAHVGTGFGDILGQLAGSFIGSQTGGMFGGGGKSKGAGGSTGDSSNWLER